MSAGSVGSLSVFALEPAPIATGFAIPGHDLVEDFGPAGVWPELVPNPGPEAFLAPECTKAYDGFKDEEEVRSVAQLAIAFVIVVPVRQKGTCLQRYPDVPIVHRIGRQEGEAINMPQIGTCVRRGQRVRRSPSSTVHPFGRWLGAEAKRGRWRRHARSSVRPLCETIVGPSPMTRVRERRPWLGGGGGARRVGGMRPVLRTVVVSQWSGSLTILLLPRYGRLRLCKGNLLRRKVETANGRNRLRLKRRRWPSSMTRFLLRGEPA